MPGESEGPYESEGQDFGRLFVTSKSRRPRAAIRRLRLFGVVLMAIVAVIVWLVGRG